MSGRLQEALERIDRFNAGDPRTDAVDGTPQPRELAYARRLTNWVERLEPQASEALRLAARGQHIGRWTVPRESYPMDRGGYLRWREGLKKFHADTLAGILRETGYDEALVERVRFLVLKKDIKEDSEAQVLEDALCLVFLETQFEDLMGKTPAEKMKDILRKTWRKMGPKGRAAALKLEVPAPARRLLAEALEGAAP